MLCLRIAKGLRSLALMSMVRVSITGTTIDLNQSELLLAAFFRIKNEHPMTVHELNTLPESKFKLQLLNCCGSNTWVNKMHALVPYEDLVELLTAAEEIWFKCGEADWLEAFQRQSTFIDEITAGDGDGSIQVNKENMYKLVKKSDEYRNKFGFIFIVFGAGKSADELLDMLQMRLQNSREEELQIAAAEQNKITQLRIQKLLA